MEAEALILPDSIPSESTQLSQSIDFPKPDFTEVVQDHLNEAAPNDKLETPLLKPTFKNALQAKKRLQAFSSARSSSLPSSPKKVKPTTGTEEKNDDAAKKTPKKGASHDDKAKAVIEEIEELKREEQAIIEMKRHAQRRSRSRSKSPDRGRFKKVDKKSRNYRRRSLSVEKQRKSPKKIKKYPKNWREFYEFEATFDLNRDFNVTAPEGNNDLLRQALFESPSLLIVPFKMKSVDREDKVVPFDFIRYTRTNPVLPYSANFGAIKEMFLTKKMISDALPRDLVASLEQLYSNSIKFGNERNIAKKSRMWYPRFWKDTENECKILESSVGLSFLQSYTGEEEENEIFEEEILPAAKADPDAIKTENKEDKSEKRGDEGKMHAKIVEKNDEERPEVAKTDKAEVCVEPAKKKKKKHRKKEAENEEKADVAVGKQKKKKRNKEKKKHADEASAEDVDAKKKKSKKDKLKKKEKQPKEKKQKRKKSREKKKKDKEKTKEKEKDKVQEEKPPPLPSPEKLNKQQVIEELKEIEEKLARKREEVKEKEKKMDKEEKSRKRKQSAREEDAKRTKHENRRRPSDENNSEAKVEHALKRKLEKAKKMQNTKFHGHVSKKPDRVEKREEEHNIKVEPKKSRHSSEVSGRKRKSRWSQDVVVKVEPPDFSDFKLIEEIRQTVPSIPFEKDELQTIKEIKETTPDTDEYHSHWESDDDITSSVPRQSLKMNRSWESDEELFDRHLSKKPSESYTNLEIPLNIKNFSRRPTTWEEKPFSVIEELKLLEEERKSLSEERKKLELEKQKILKLQEETKLDQEDKNRSSVEEKKGSRLRSSTPEEVVKVKKEKCEANDFNIDSLNNSLLSNVSSTESNYPIAVLENEYEEFIKAVSSEPTVLVTSKKKPERRDSDSISSAWSSDSDHKKRKRKKKKKKKKRSRECEGLLLGKGNDIFNEFDIPVPSDLPEMVPTPVPVPSPILPLNNILPLSTPNILLNSIVELSDKMAVGEKQLEVVDFKTPFMFSSIVLPNKKTTLVDNSNLKLDDDDSNSVDFTDKFLKKTDVKETKPEDNEVSILLEKETEKEEPTEEPENVVEEEKVKSVEEVRKEEEPEKIELPETVLKTIDDIQNVPLPPPKEPPLSQPRDENETKIKQRSRSVSPSRKPIDKFRDKRRSRSRSRDRDMKRRSPIRRRDLTPPSRRRMSPRRRSPPRRRGSPRRRSPSPRRRSLSPRRRSPRRRRRSPSLSPPRSRGGARKRTPSPRRRASPLNSPLDGFKRSVADSTISDDMLPQPTPDEYNESPNSYGGGAKYYDRKLSKTLSISPQMSPKRISLDDRINQVLGLEKNELPPLPPPKPIETYPNYNYSNSYVQPVQQQQQQLQPQQYPSYNQYTPQKNEYVPQPFGAMLYTQPPPPIVKPVPTPSKVVQVGNILQVVPTEELPPPPKVEHKTPERSQKIVQVGNMLQIVPAIMPTIKLPVPEPPPPVPKPIPMPEKQSAEAMMKQKLAERKAEREKRRQERERRRKEKEKKRKEKEKRKQIKLKIKTENMIKRAIQIETEALANDEIEEEAESADLPVQWPPVPVIVSTPPSCKSILLQGGSKLRKSVQFADGVRPGEGTSPSAGEELSSPPPRKLPKEKRFKKLKIPKKSKKKKVRVKVVKVQSIEEDDDDDDEDNLPPPSPPPGSPPPHVFPSRVKTHTINNVHQYVGNLIPTTAPGFPYRPPMPVVMNRPPPGFIPAFPTDVNSLSHPSYQGVSSHH